MNLNIHNSIIQLTDYLKFSFKYYNKNNIIFYVNDKNYYININISKNIDISFIQDISDIKYNILFELDEKLLITLYNSGVNIKDLVLYIKNNKIKTNNFNIFKFYSFIKNFDFSQNKWNEFLSK